MKKVDKKLILKNLNQIKELDVIEKRNEERRVEMLTNLKAAADIPRRYRDAKLKPITKEQEFLYAVFTKNINPLINKKLDGLCDFVIYGTIGTGKTYLTIGLLNALLERGIGARYTTESRLMELYCRKDYTGFDNIKKSSFLVIDEVGKRELAHWQLVQLEELISYRYEEMLPTVYITNKSKEQFKKIIGERAVDRLRENKVKQIEFKGASLRG